MSNFNPIRYLIDIMFNGEFKVASWVLVEVKKYKEDTPTSSFVVQTTFGELNGIPNIETAEQVGEMNLDVRYFLIKPEDINDFSPGGGDFIYFIENSQTKPEDINKVVKVDSIGSVFQIQKIYPMRGLNNNIDYYLLYSKEV